MAYKARPEFFIGIELTRHCNLRCAHCFRADLDKFAELPFALLESLLHQAKAYGKPHIALTGGETSLHTQFPDILNLLCREEFTFHFVTNGFKYKSIFAKIAPFINSPNWTGISLSLDGASRSTHDSVRGPGSYDDALAMLVAIKACRKEVVVQMVVHRGNAHEIDDMAKLCAQLQVDRLHIALMQPTPHTVKHNLLHSPQEFRDVEHKVADLRDVYKMPVLLSAGFYDVTPLAHCKFLKFSALNIDYRGRLTTCCQLSNFEGDLTEQDVVADLNKTSLPLAHKELNQHYQAIFTARLQAMANNTFHDLDHFHCWHCMKHFKKVEWMRDFPDNEWVQQDPYFSRAVQLKVVNK